MPALSEYTNVYGIALAHLERLGFQVWHDKQADLFCAERDGWDFMAESPVGLLGLVKLWELAQPEAWSEYWWRTVEPVDHSRLPEAPPRPYTSVIRRGPRGDAPLAR